MAVLPHLCPAFYVRDSAAFICPTTSQHLTCLYLHTTALYLQSPHCAGLCLATSLTLGRKDNLHKVLLWVHSHRVAGFIIFCLLYIWFTVLFLPPALLAACAGAIYGFLPAIPLVSVCLCTA
jgi:uncharacterized membrane protein YdjX (TVP38/TMEM64 family)